MLLTCTSSWSGMVEGEPAVDWQRSRGRRQIQNNILKKKHDTFVDSQISHCTL